MKNNRIPLFALCAGLVGAAAPAYAAAGILNEVGTMGIVAIIVVVGVCTYFMKKFMG
ncbi:MAG: hypothetical protein RRY12_11545 [Cloacibacillus sp.]